MSYEEPEIHGDNNGIPWVYSGTFNNDKGVYRGCLQTNYEDDNERIGNLELRLLDSNSSDNLDSHYLWYSLSDFDIDPKFRRKGFGKIILERATNFARGQQVAVVKRIKATSEALHLLDDLVHFLTSHGFKRFDERTYYYTYDGEDAVKQEGGGK